MTVALYCRVSTEEQAQQGFSIEAQQERLVAYCQSQGWNAYRLYTDDGESGTHMKRPALQGLLRDIRSGHIETVIVYKLDRLGRRQRDVLHLLEEVFEENGVAFRSVTEPFDTSTPLGKAILGILAVFAQLERDTIVERSTMGRQQRARHGLWPGGPVPFGYSWDKAAQQLRVIPDQAMLIGEVFERYIHGHSYLSIATWLRGCTVDRKVTKKFVTDLVTRPLYAGYILTRDGLIDSQHPAIVDRATWDLAVREHLRRRQSRVPRRDYLLSGLLVCGLCGSRLKHISYRPRRSDPFQRCYYVCTRQAASKRACNLGYLRDDDLEDRVLAELKRLTLDPTTVAAEFASLGVEDVDRRKTLPHLQMQLQNVAHTLGRWTRAFDEGTLDALQFADHIAHLDKKRRMLETRLEESASSQRMFHTTRSLAGVPFQSKSIGDCWKYLIAEERRTIARTAIRHIIVHGRGQSPTIVWNPQCGGASLTDD